MQRHRNDQIRLRHQRAPGALQPARESRRRIETVAMLEAEDQGFGGVIIAKEGPGAIEIRRFGVAWPADRFAARIDVEGHAATRAERAVDEGHRAPTGGAESMRLAETRPARHAQLRKHQIEDSMRPTAYRSGGGDAYSPLGVHGLTLVWRIRNPQ